MQRKGWTEESEIVLKNEKLHSAAVKKAEISDVLFTEYPGVHPKDCHDICTAVSSTSTQWLTAQLYIRQLKMYWVCYWEFQHSENQTTLSKGQFILKSKTFTLCSIYPSRLFWSKSLSFGAISWRDVHLLLNKVGQDGTRLLVTKSHWQQTTSASGAA